MTINMIKNYCHKKIINKINAQLKTIILAHYKKHKLNDTLDIFQYQFCINEALAKIENNLLTIQP